MENTGIFNVSIIRNNIQYFFEPEDIIELNIAEDIFSFCMVGNIMFYDKVGWTEQNEMLGFDPITVSYQENGNRVDKVFRVYHYEALVEEAQLESGIRTAKWYFVEPMYYSLNTTRYSKAWGENVLGSTIITDICQNMLDMKSDFIQFENTNETFNNFYMPYWTPSEAIRWIMKRSSGSSSLLPGYLFYINSQGWNFTTLESLVNSAKRERDNDGNIINYTFVDSSDNTYNVLNWYVNPPDLTSLKYLSGSTRYGFAFEGKKILSSEYTYSETVDKYSLLGESTLFDDISDSEMNVVVEGESDITKMNNLNDGDFITRYSKQLTAGLVVRGGSNRYAGMLINVDWRSSDATQVTDKMMEGLYLVTSITHQFTPGVNSAPPYRQLLICSKTGYGKTSQSKPKQLINTNPKKVIKNEGVVRK